MNRLTRATAFAAWLLFTAASSPAQTAPTAQRRVAVNEITVTGNTLLEAARIDAVLARYKGERTLDELKDAAASLQSLYRQAGYGAVVAYLPEQALGSGRLVIAVLEGKLARVEVVGNRRVTVANVRRAVPALQEGQTPLVQRIDAQVQLANDNPARKLALTLEAGARPGEVDARVLVTEEAPARTAVTFDNTGNAQTGRTRLGLAWQHASLFDRDHQVALQAQFSPEKPGKVRIYSGTYRAPWYDAGLMFGLYATYSNVDAGTTATAAGPLQFNGKGRVLGASVTRLFDRWAEFDQRLTLSLDNRDYLNNCTIEGLAAGACGSAGESVSVQPLALDYSAQRGGDRPAGFSAGLVHNLALGGRYGGVENVQAVRADAKRGYTLLRFGGFATLPLSNGYALALRARGQASGDALVAGEQVGLAGVGAVRGYDERELAADSGVAINVEVLAPGLADGTLQFLAFADAGYGSNRFGTLCNNTDSRCTVASVGVGGRYARGPVQLRLDLAQALRDARATRRHDGHLHVSASVSFP